MSTPTTARPIRQRLAQQRSFSVRWPQTLYNFLLAGVAAVLIWVPLVYYHTQRITVALAGDDHGHHGPPNAFAVLLANSAYAPAPAMDLPTPSLPGREPDFLRAGFEHCFGGPGPDETASEENVRRMALGIVRKSPAELDYLSFAIQRMELRDAAGNPLPPDLVRKVAEHLRTRLTPVEGDASLFTFDALEMLALFVQKSALNPVGDRNSEHGTDQISLRTLIRQIAVAMTRGNSLDKPAEIVSAALTMGEIQSSINHRVDALLAAPGDTKSGAADPAPGSAEFEAKYWHSAIHPILVRLVQMAQTDELVRTARFRLTFFHGVDQLAMIWIFLFFTLMILGRIMELQRAKRDWRAVERCLDEGKNLRDAHERGELPLLGRVAWVWFMVFPLNAPRCRCRAFVPSMVEVAYARDDHGKPDQDLLFLRADSFRGSNARSSWLQSWCTHALPVAGFLGKLVGLAVAMQHSDLVARVTGQYPQAAAITMVSGALGTAFTATLSAFGLALFAKLFAAAQAHREDEFIDEVEAELQHVRSTRPALAAVEETSMPAPAPDAPTSPEWPAGAEPALS